MDQIALQQFASSVNEGSTLFVIGTGSSIAGVESVASSPTVTWRGLIEHGLLQARSYAGKSESWLHREQQKLADAFNEGDLQDVLEVASIVEERLGAPDGGEWAAWLRQTIGCLSLSRPRIPKAILALARGRILTTNYDSILTQASGGSLQPVPWTNGRGCARIVRGETQGVVHLHGHWETPESVVLGNSSYRNVLSSEHGQAIQGAVATLKTLVFVGFGGGLEDPNFGRLLSWMRIFKKDEHRHFRLCLEKDAAALRQQHSPEQRIQIIPYGQSHDDLGHFLERLVPAKIEIIPQSLPTESPTNPSSYHPYFMSSDVFTLLLAKVPQMDQIIRRGQVVESKSAATADKADLLEKEISQKLFSTLGQLRATRPSYEETRTKIINKVWMQEEVVVLDYDDPARGAILWSSGDEYIGQFDANRARGLGIVKVFKHSIEITPAPAFYRGEVYEDPANDSEHRLRYGRYGIFQFDSSIGSFAGEWSDGHPLFGTYVNTSGSFPYDTYLGSMAGFPGYKDQLTCIPWVPHGYGIAVDRKTSQIIYGKFVKGFPDEVAYVPGEALPQLPQ